MKQITQIVHNKVKNPNWSEANQLAVNKRGGGFELGATENNPASGQGETWTRGLRVSSSALEDLNSGLLRKNPASGQGGTWTRGLRISSSPLEDLNSGLLKKNPASSQGRTWTRYLPNASPAF